MNETVQLCVALREAGYQKEAVSDPVAWNAALTNEQIFEGYLWIDGAAGWIPNPGRRALVKEIKTLIGEDKFTELYAGMDYTGFTHEGWMQAWLDNKKVVDEQNK